MRLVERHACLGGIATHLQLLQLLEDHVVGHVVEQPVGSREDDVTELDVKGRAVCCVGTARTDGSRSHSDLNALTLKAINSRRFSQLLSLEKEQMV